MGQTSPYVDIADPSSATAAFLGFGGTEEDSAGVAPAPMGGIADAAIGLDRPHRWHADRRHAFLAALAAYTGDATDQIEVAIVHPHQFAHTHPGAVERLEDGAVTQRGLVIALWCGEQRL